MNFKINENLDASCKLKIIFKTLKKIIVVKESRHFKYAYL